MKIIVLFCTLVLSMNLFSQQIEIVTPSDLENDISGTTVEAVGDKSDNEVYYEFRVINTTSELILVKYLRYRDVNSGRTDQICDSKVCFSAPDVDVYSTPIFDTLFPGVPTLFKPQIMPGGNESCAVHTYKLMGEQNQIYDSIRVIFKTTNAECNLSTKSEADLSFSVYPNPTQDLVSFEGEALKNGGTVVFMDALGKEVKRASISSSNHQVNVSALKRGVYFVNIIDQSGSKSTVQRLIKQ